MEASADQLERALAQELEGVAWLEDSLVEELDLRQVLALVGELEPWVLQHNLREDLLTMILELEACRRYRFLLVAQVKRHQWVRQELVRERRDHKPAQIVGCFPSRIFGNYSLDDNQHRYHHQLHRIL